MRAETSAHAATSPDAMPGGVASRVPGSRQRRGRYVRMMADVIGCLMKRPLTVMELMDATGREDHTSGQYSTIASYIDAFRGEGLVYIVEWAEYQKNRFAPRYGWQPSVLFHADAIKPAKKVSS